ncbi:MAG: ABC transporter ATP-binding protein [Acidimicrobiia bacterium]
MTIQTVAAAISVANLSKVFDTPSGPVEALRDVNMEVKPGELVCLVGPSGCGKSTLLRTLAGLTEPTAGTVAFGEPDGSPARKTMVFQDHGLFPWMSLLDNVAFALEADGVDKVERKRRAAALLEQLGLSEFQDRFPDQLSGGMRQRAAIGRALLGEPQVLLMDEPFSALDAQSKLVMQEELMRLWGSSGQTVVYVTHDIREAVVLGDRVLVMTGRPGTIQLDLEIELPRPRDVFDRDHPEVKEKSWTIWNAIEGQVRRNLHIPS